MADDNDREQPDIDLSLDDLDADEPAGLPAAAPVPSMAPGGDTLVIDSLDLDDIPAAPPPGPAGAGYPAAAAYPGVEPGAYAAVGKGKKGALSGGLVGSLLIQMAIAGALGGILAWGLTEPVAYLGDTGSSGVVGTYGIICLAIAVAAAGGLGMALGFSQWSAGGAATYLGPIAGLVGGAILGAAAVGIGILRSRGYEHSAETAVLYTTVFAAIIGVCTGLCIGVVNGIYEGNVRKLLIGGGIGLGSGLVCGAVGGIFAQIIYGFLSPDSQELTVRQIMARTIGWGIAGLAVGVGLGVAHGLPAKSVKKIVNGLMGGAVGGFAGGFLFDPLGMALGGLGSRLLAITLIGGLSGAAIGLIEQLRKQAWLAVVGGPLTGKQFIIYNQVTTIGSSPKCDIALLKDPHIAAQHCVIEAAGAAYHVRDLGAGTTVNGRPVQRQALRAGDVIQIGSTALEYQDRHVS
ncbi:MAG: FHA domain-containing protein [Armatimonadetes bacterium]|nr:FHA domain-containing protein [Armatimonadota bacterium]